MADPAIRWRHDIDYYNRVAVKLYGTKGTATDPTTRAAALVPLLPGTERRSLRRRRRLPQWVDPFLALRNWVEKGTDPDFLVGLMDWGRQPGTHPAALPIPADRDLQRLWQHRRLPITTTAAVNLEALACHRVQ